MGLARKAAESIESKRRKPESQETAKFGAIKKIEKQTARSIYRVNARNQEERQEETELLLERLEASYDEMVDTLVNYGYTDEIPDKGTVMAAIFNLGPEMLKNIGKFGKPTLLMTPAGDLAGKIKKIDENRKYSNAEGLQGKTFFWESTFDPLWGPPPSKLRVTIVDGAVEMPQLPAKIARKDWERQHRWLTNEYKKRGMKMITIHEYAMLAQKSLHSFEIAKNIPGGKPEDAMIDERTVTAFNAEHLMNLKKVPCGRWNSHSRQFVFSGRNPASRYHNSDMFRSRPSVLVMEV